MAAEGEAFPAENLNLACDVALQGKAMENIEGLIGSLFRKVAAPGLVIFAKGHSLEIIKI